MSSDKITVCKKQLKLVISSYTSTSSVYILHLILYGFKNELDGLIQGYPQYNLFRNASQHNTLVLLNYKLTHDKGYSDYFDPNLNIYYLYYPSIISNTYGESQNYLLLLG